MEEIMGENLGSPAKNGAGQIGKSGKEWGTVWTDKIGSNEVEYTLPDADGTAGQVLATDGSATLSWAAAGGATAFDDIGDPDAAGTIAFTTFAQTLTSTKTDGDNINIQGLGAFGDISVVRIEQKTGNPTDGTVLEVVAADANVDPLVVSSSNQANALVVGQNAGTVAIAAAATVGGTLGVTGLTTATAGVAPGSAASVYKTDTITLTSAEVKALRAAPKVLVAAPAAGYFIELVSATLALNYGSNVFSETTDNLVIQYNTSGLDASAAIETTGFLDQNADMIAVVKGASIAGAAATSYAGLALELSNSGDGEIDGNAANDSTLIVKVTYIVHATGL
jgi:fibronectin-binding autotransporter adhesin